MLSDLYRDKTPQVQASVLGRISAAQAVPPPVRNTIIDQLMSDYPPGTQVGPVGRALIDAIALYGAVVSGALEVSPKKEEPSVNGQTETNTASSSPGVPGRPADGRIAPDRPSIFALLDKLTRGEPTGPCPSCGAYHFPYTPGPEAEKGAATGHGDHGQDRPAAPGAAGE